MSENNEQPTDLNAEPALELEPEPSAVHAAVKEALIPEQPAVQQIKLAPCPCSAGETNLMLDAPAGSKVGRASCSVCGVWGVDFLVPRSQSQELIATAAAKAWNEAPRG